MEQWKDVRGYEGSYQVSNLGGVRSVDRYVRTGDRHKRLIKGKVLKPQISNKGYLFVTLSKESKELGFFVHTLVAKAFIPNPDMLPEVNHKDENKQNNIVDNLEWCTSKYNNNYGSHKEKCAEKQINGNRSKSVSRYTLKGEFVDSFPSMREVWRKYGYNTSVICNCCKGKVKSAYGYVWKYN